MLTRRCWHAFVQSVSSCAPLILLCIFPLLLSAPAQESRSQPQRPGSERQLPEHRPADNTSLQGIIRDPQGNVIPGVQIDLRNTSGPEKYSVVTGAEGIFRLRNIRFGVYEVSLAREGFKTLVVPR